MGTNDIGGGEGEARTDRSLIWTEKKTSATNAENVFIFR